MALSVKCEDLGRILAHRCWQNGSSTARSVQKNRSDIPPVWFQESSVNIFRRFHELILNTILKSVGSAIRMF